MNSKMITNSQLSATEPKKKKKQKQTKQTTKQNRITEMEITWRVISGKGQEENGGKVTGNKKHNW